MIPYMYFLYLWSLMFQPHYPPGYVPPPPVYWSQTMPIQAPAPVILIPFGPPCHVVQANLTVCG